MPSVCLELYYNLIYGPHNLKVGVFIPILHTSIVSVSQNWDSSFHLSGSKARALYTTLVGTKVWAI